MSRRPVQSAPGAQILRGDPSWSSWSDEALVLRALEGERWAEEVLFRRHAREVAATVERLLMRQHEAEDVVQETFMAALAELPKLRDPRAFRGWLLQIAVRKTHRRFRRRRVLRLLGLDRGADDRTLASLVAPGMPAEARAELALLEARLTRLPLADRTAWMLRHVDGRSLGEVAVACDCSLATAKRRIARAQAALGIELGGDDA